MARRRERLDDLANEVGKEYSVGVEVMPLDLSVAAARRKLADRLRNEPIAGLCNSAGFGTSGVFYELPVERESEEVTLNSLVLMELTHAALPGMVERGAGAVMNIASIAGFQPIPYMAVYSATKAFVQTFSEAIHEELHGTGVSVTVLCPGPVPTEWAEIANAERFSIPVAQVSPQDVAEAAIGGMLAGKRSVVPGVVPKVVSYCRAPCCCPRHRRPIRAAHPAAARDPDRQPISRGGPSRAQMAAVDVTADMPMSPHDMWDHVADLSSLGEWLVMHEGWRSELPDEITEGIQVVGVARSKGLRNRVTWTVTTWDPPHEVAMSGSGKGGTKYGVRLTVQPTKDGSALGLRLELGGRALFGPVGSAAARAVRGDVEKSLKQFVELYG